jgi:hypothetical protein
MWGVKTTSKVTATKCHKSFFSPEKHRAGDMNLLMSGLCVFSLIVIFNTLNTPTR